MSSPITYTGNGVQTRFEVPGSTTKVVQVNGVVVTPASSDFQSVTLSAAPGVGVPVSIAYVGASSPVDSATALVSGATNLASGPSLVAALGDSITAYAAAGSVNINFLTYQPHGFLTWAMGFSMGALWCPLVGTPNNATPLVNYNRGVTGETAEQTLARVVELDALPVKPKFCTVLVGTNNLQLNQSQTATQIAAVIISICAAVRSRGITPILCTLLPRGNGGSAGTTGWGASFTTTASIITARGRLLEINRQLRSYAGATPGVILADTFYAILNQASATSDPISTLTGAASATPDYLHPNVPGSQLVGKVVWDAVAPYVNQGVNNTSGQGDSYSLADNYYGSMWDSSYAANGGAAGTGVSAALAWAATTAYVANNIVTTGGNLIRCVVVGTSGSVAPLNTSGQFLDGTVLWEFVATGASNGVPVNWTAARSVGASSTAQAATTARADGKAGNEYVLSITPLDALTTFQDYPTATGGGFPDANFVAGDAVYLEEIVSVVCGSALCSGVPDMQFRVTTSAYVGLYQLHTTLPSSGVASHAQGSFTCLFRSPILDAGASNIQGIGGVVALASARSGGTGAVNVTRRNRQIRKYNKSAPGAITW